MAPLSKKALTDLSLADPGAVEAAFAHLKRYMERDRWVGTNNAYRVDTINSIQRDVDAGALNQKHMAEYIAASVPLHVVDGWSFLGRALQAHLIGDTASARHLGYYAELRAAMSLLASQGIGVFSRQHFVVTTRTEVRKVRTSEGTHSMAWQALKWWADTPGSAVLVSNAISPYQTDLSSWLGALPRYGVWEPVARDWILSFGLDLQRVADDQQSRNIASYRPSRLTDPPAVAPRTNAEFAIALWMSLEPTPTGFVTIDQHFLRSSFEEAFRAVEGSRPSDAPVRYAAIVDTFLDANSVEEPRRSMLRRFLLRESGVSDDLLLARNATVDSPIADANHHLHVMSRAALLLVLATAAARRMIRAAGLSFSDIAFWWALLGVDRGLWADKPPLDVPLFDYWDDIRDELDQLQAWLDSGHDNVASLVSSSPGSFARLSQLELVAVWGMAG